jgi:tripartite-type tricarboxylate transporter receptor subunit TctC
VNPNQSLSRRSLLAVAAAAATLPASVLAQDHRPIEWVVGYAAGGGSDVVARTVAEAMGRTLGQTIVINNKPGAATNIAAGYVASAKDTSGHTLFTADFATLAANPWLFSKLPYDPARDFIPVGMLARFPLLLVVGPNVPAKNFREFVAWVKAQPNGVGYASAGIGSPHHLAGELLRERTGLKLQHVAYRGAAPAVQDLLSGTVPFGMIDTASVQQYLAAGKLRALGVASPARVPTLPDIPTLSEQGLANFVAFAWQGLVVPAGTPAAIVAKNARALQAALESTQVKARFQALGLEAMPGTPQQMATFTHQERDRWGQLVHSAGIKLD